MNNIYRDILAHLIPPWAVMILDKLEEHSTQLNEVKVHMATIDEKLDTLTTLTTKVYEEGKANTDIIATLKQEIDDLKAGGSAASAADLQRWSDKLDGVINNTSALDTLNPDAPAVQ